MDRLSTFYKGKGRWALASLAAGLVLTGCARVPVHQQRLLAKPNMLFSDSSVHGWSSRLLSQIETGAGAAGGAQAAGCSSCR